MVKNLNCKYECNYKIIKTKITLNINMYKNTRSSTKIRYQIKCATFEEKKFNVTFKKTIIKHKQFTSTRIEKLFISY